MVKKSRKRQRKRRAIIVIRPIVELTDSESDMTVMQWLFGERLQAWVLNHKRLMLLLTMFLTLSNYVSVFPALVTSDIRAAFIAALTCAVGTCLVLVSAIAGYNRKLFFLTLRTFDAQLFIGETLLVSMAFVGLSCFNRGVTLSGLRLFSI